MPMERLANATNEHVSPNNLFLNLGLLAAPKETCIFPRHGNLGYCHKPNARQVSHSFSAICCATTTKYPIVAVQKIKEEE